MSKHSYQKLVVGLFAASICLVGKPAFAKAKLVRQTFGSLLLKVAVPQSWTKLEQTTKKVKFRSAKKGHSLTITRKFGKKDINSIAAGVKKAWRSKGWAILVDKRGKLRGTNHPAMILQAHHAASKVKVALYVVNVRNRVYTAFFGNKAKKFKPKLYNRIMLTFDAI